MACGARASSARLNARATTAAACAKGPNAPKRAVQPFTAGSFATAFRAPGNAREKTAGNRATTGCAPPDVTARRVA